MKKNIWKKFIFNVILLLLFSDSLSFCQSSPNSVTFTKKEIAFLKWGKGSNEVSLGKDEFVGMRGRRLLIMIIQDNCGLMVMAIYTFWIVVGMTNAFLSCQPMVNRSRRSNSIRRVELQM